MSEHQHSVPSGPSSDPAQPTEAELMAQMREQLASVSAADFVAELAAHLLNMATVRLGLPPERHGEFMDLDQARLLIDALAGLLEGAKGRLGPIEPQLRDGLAQFRMAWVELAQHAGTGGGGDGGPDDRGGQDGEGDGDQGPRLTRPPSGLWVPGMD